MCTNEGAKPDRHRWLDAQSDVTTIPSSFEVTCQDAQSQLQRRPNFEVSAKTQTSQATNKNKSVVVFFNGRPPDAHCGLLESEREATHAWPRFFFFVFLCILSFHLLHALTFSLILQGWHLVVPAHVIKVEHVTLFAQDEFASLCEQHAQGSSALATLCWRMAKRLSEDRASASAPTPGGVTVNQGGATNTMTGPTIHVNIMPEQGQGSASAQPSKKAWSVAGRSSSGLGQQSLPALFGQPLSFVGLDDLEVLGRAKWPPIESGGHSSTSAISNFRNKFIADYIRNNPTLSLNDKSVEKKVKAMSFEAYNAQSKAKRSVEEAAAGGESLAAAEGVGLKRLPSIDGVQGVMRKDGVLDIERVGEFGEYEFYAGDDAEKESAPSRLEPAKKRGPPAMTASQPVLAKKPSKPADKTANSAAKPAERRAAGSTVLDLTTTPVVEQEEAPQKSAAEMAAAGVQMRKRALQTDGDDKDDDDDDDDDESSSHGEVDLVKEAVNPYGKPANGFTNKQLKVAVVFSCRVFLLLSYSYH